MKRYDAIDAIRGVAVLGVMLVHTGIYDMNNYHVLVRDFITNGARGVQLFFLVSAFTLVAQLPAEFPNQINQEPIFGTSWDLSSALSLIYPDIKIDANVLWPPATVVNSDGITIFGYWTAAYPFSFYSYQDDVIYTIASENDWVNVVGAQP